jgi:D-beta-D-heptose 7-phosphate kinase/D-beta-D-heptose 1-phosphate adenosyltransferase
VAETVVVITGGFDPLHSGHLSYIKAASELGDILVVGVNSDEWLVRKKGRSFMPFEERIQIIQALRGVRYAIPFNDEDSSAKDAIHWARKAFPQSKIIFANGGDRTLNNIPEMDVVDDNIEFVFGVGGGDKANSSSWILEEWKSPKTERQWGYYRVLHEIGTNVKLKELTVDPGKKLSLQRHFKRSELWFVSEGVATLYTIDYSSDYSKQGTYEKFVTIHIPKNEWHQLANETDSPLKIIEIQYGEDCIEEDIERK